MQHNVENIGLEPVWPYGLIGDDSSMTPRQDEPFSTVCIPTNQDGSFDPIQAARLGLGKEVAATLIKLTEKCQAFANGFATWHGDSGEFYIEQSGVTAIALQEALVQDYDGILRIAPALTPRWDFAGTVAIHDNGKVYIQTRSGAVQVCVVEPGTSKHLRTRSPWPGEPFDVVDDRTGSILQHAVTESSVNVQTIAGNRYILRRSQSTAGHIRFASITGVPARTTKHLGSRHLGLAASAAPATDFSNAHH